MEDMARRFADRAHFLFVYVREAHPGEVYPPHQYIEQKFLHAASFKERLGTERPIAVDSLYGRVHRIYGGVSNMSWIIDHTGHVAFRAAWTVAADIEAALEETLRVRELRREGRPVSVYYREMTGLRPLRERPEGGQHFLGGKVAEEQFAAARRDRVAQPEDP
ncbi:MAG: hypothetical protein IH869_02640 [Chloroflexi bacterium]|nr:hypothetical protein [Chloroflexota bacterium]